MIIENPEAFKAWMAKVLEPMCDADPEALAKYIYALVKKDKPTEDLRKSTIAQLEVFLNKETKNFVDLMFAKLEVGFKDDTLPIKIKEEPMDKEHVETTGAGDESVVSSLTTSIEDQLLETGPTASLQIETEHIPIPATEKPAAILTDARPAVVIPPPKDQVPVRVESPRLRNGSYETANQNKPPERERRLSSSRSDKKSDSEREGRGEPSRWRGGSISPPVRGRERSRSRSWERRSSTRRSRSKSRRSRSRGKERDRSRAWRNKSPPLRSRYDRDRKMRSWSKSPPPRSRSRSPPAKPRSRYRNRSPAGRSRSRSHSPYVDVFELNKGIKIKSFRKIDSLQYPPDKSYNPPYSVLQIKDSPHKSTPMSGGATPPQDSGLGDELRVSQNLQSVVLSKKRRCRDFDEKGFCMRGEMCPYDHGKDPVVLEDVGQVLSFSAPGLPPPTPQPPPPAMVPPGLALHHRPQLINRPPPNLAEYNPDAPSMEPRMWSKQPFRTAAGRGLAQRGGVMRAPPGFPPHHQRELISVPVMEGEEGPPYYNSLSNPMKRQCPPEFSNEMESMPPAKQRFDYSRLGARGRIGNCSLQLKKIPPGLNNIAHLHNHFFKFGKIVSIQVNFEGDPEGALITFTSHAEASAAYKSTEAVLNNRFIKVFWYNPEKDQNKQENISPLNRPSAKERLGAPVVNNAPPAIKHVDQNNEMEKVLISGSNITKTVYIPTAMEKKQPLSQPKRMIVQTTFTNNQDMQVTRNSIKKKQEEKRKEALKLTQHLCKRKYELIEKLLCHQKQLIEKLEKGNVAPEQRAEILTAIKGFQENIDVIRKDIKSVVKPVNNAVKVSPQLVKRTREETQKQILDAELDIFNQQQEGKDTTELQKRVLELKTKAHNLGLLANNGVLRLARGGARFRSGRGRGGFNPHATVDHRPTKLLVSGFESDDKAEVLQHFSKFGEVVDHVWDEATPALVIQFKTRKDAETAMAKGRNFQDRLLSVTWFSSAQNMGMRSSRSVILLNDSSMSDLLSEHDDEEEALRINLDQNEDFLLQDEEEEEDEERSWRR